MTDAKKFYWLKLKDTFFQDKEIKKLRKIAGGDTYTIIYLKMQLLSLKNNGKIIFDRLEETFADEIALILDEEVDNVKITLIFLEKCGLIEEVSDDEFILPQAIMSIGSETQGAERVRRFREHNKALQCNALPLQCNTDVTKCNTEIRDKRKDKREKKKDNTQKISYAEFVTLTEEEYQKLLEAHGQEAVKKIIEILDNYKGANGKKYNSDYRAILNWVIDRYKKENNPAPKKERFNDYAEFG